MKHTQVFIQESLVNLLFINSYLLSYSLVNHSRIAAPHVRCFVPFSLTKCFLLFPQCPFLPCPLVFFSLFVLKPYQCSRGRLTFTQMLMTPQDSRRFALRSPLSPLSPYLFLSFSFLLLLLLFSLPGQLDRESSPSWLVVVIKHLFLVHLTLGLISYKVN